MRECVSSGFAIGRVAYDRQRAFRHVGDSALPFWVYRACSRISAPLVGTDGAWEDGRGLDDLGSEILGPREHDHGSGER